MKTSLLLMQKYLELVETMGDIVEILERPIAICKEKSATYYAKHDQYRKHAEQFIVMVNEDLHMFLRIDNECKEIEQELESGEDNEETKKD